MINTPDYYICGTNEPEPSHDSAFSSIIWKSKSALNIGKGNVQDIVVVKDGIKRVATPISYLPSMDYTRSPPVYKTKVRYENNDEEILSWRSYQVFPEDLDFFNAINGNGIRFGINYNSRMSFGDFFNLKKENIIPENIQKRIMKEYGVWLKPFFFNYDRILTLGNLLYRSIDPLMVQLGMSENIAALAASGVMGNFREMKDIKRAVDEVWGDSNDMLLGEE